MTIRAIMPRAAQNHRRIAVGLTLVALTLSARAAFAQKGEDTLPRSHVLPALGIRFGTPQKASAALGVVLGEDWQKNGRDHSRNVALFVEPGLSAGRASLAYISHGYGTFGSGFSIGPTLLRTWKEPWTVKPNVSYIGAEATIWPVVFIGPRIGIFRSIGDNEPSHRWFVSFDFGIGV